MTINCGGFRKSTDGGETWEVKNLGLEYEEDGCRGGKIEGFNIHPVYGTYFVGTKSWRIYTSDNGADYWNLSYDVYDHYENPGRKDFFGTFAFDPNNPDIVYAGVWNMDTFESDEFLRAETQGLILKGQRVFDDGEYVWEWSEFANSNSFPELSEDEREKIGFPAIVIHPDNSNIIFAGTTFGLYKTSNGGLSWRRVDLETGTGVELYSTGNVVIDPIEHNIMYVTVITCPDNTISTGKYCCPDAEMIGCSNSDPKPDLWHGGILKSVDGGYTWYPINDGLDKGFYKHGGDNKCFPLNYFDIKIDPSNHNRIYTGQFFQHTHQYRNSIVYRSDDGGESGWYEIAYYRVLDETEETNIEFAWKEASDGYRVLSCGKVLINPANPNEVYFYGRPAQVFKTENALSKNISWRYLGVEETEDGFWRTTGLEGIATPHGIGINPGDSNRVLYLFADHETFLSKDGGYTLKPVIKHTDGGKVVYDKYDPNLLYVARAGPGHAGYKGVVHKSTNKGEEGSWVIIGGSKDNIFGLPNGAYTDIIFDNPDINTRRLYVPLYKTKSDGVEKGIYRKDGVGTEEWELIWNNKKIRSLEGYPDDDFTYIFAGVDEAGIYRLNISAHPDVIAEKMADCSLVGNIIYELKKDSKGNIYAATSNGIWTSADSGQHWQLLRSVKEAWDFAIHPENDDLMYIASAIEGIWRSSDGGDTWTDVTDGVGTRIFMTLSLDPNDQGKVIAATACSGEWIGHFLEPIIGDLDCDGDVDYADIGILLSFFGIDDGGDLDGDGDTDQSDLLVLLTNWTGSP